MKVTCYPSVLAAMILTAAASEPDDVASAAQQYYPETVWQPGSVLTGDFSCHGNEDVAILGASATSIFVAVFLGGLEQAPQVLEYSASVRNAQFAMLAIEPIGASVEEIEADIGYVPEGMRPSTSCVGLNMGDGEVDSAHIYWDHDAQRFKDWVR